MERDPFGNNSSSTGALRRRWSARASREYLAVEQQVHQEGRRRRLDPTGADVALAERQRGCRRPRRSSGSRRPDLGKRWI